MQWLYCGYLYQTLHNLIRQKLVLIAFTIIIQSELLLQKKYGVRALSLLLWNYFYGIQMVHQSPFPTGSCCTSLYSCWDKCLMILSNSIITNISYLINCLDRLFSQPNHMVEHYLSRLNPELSLVESLIQIIRDILDPKTILRVFF